MRTYGKYLKLKSAVHLRRRRHAAADRRAARAASTSSSPRPAACSTTCSRRRVDLRQVEILVLDEADRMLDMGFIHDISRILALLPAKRQNLLFSATFPDEIRKLAASFMNDPVTVEVARRNTPAELVAPGAAPGRQRPQARAARAPGQDERLAPGAGVHADQARRQPPRAAARAQRHRGRRDPRQQEPERAHPRARALQGRASCACWWRPTSPRAASTSRSCRTSSTSTCRTCPRTTCTASAAPAARASKAKRCRW